MFPQLILRFYLDFENMSSLFCSIFAKTLFTESVELLNIPFMPVTQPCDTFLLCGFPFRLLWHTPTWSESDKEHYLSPRLRWTNGLCLRWFSPLLKVQWLSSVRQVTRSYARSQVNTANRQVYDNKDPWSISPNQHLHLTKQINNSLPLDRYCVVDYLSAGNYLFNPDWFNEELPIS